mgnify:CR=1 FL=1|jgi:actin-like protein 6A
MAIEAIGRTDIDIRRDLYSSIIISGGTANFKNMTERLSK